jgi:acetylornithine aminotransferase
MQASGLLENAADVGAYLKSGLEDALHGVAGVQDIRGRGLMLGIELDRPCGALVGQAANAGLLISVTADKVIRMVPPLILSTTEAQEIIDILVPLVKGFLAEAKG